MDNTINANTTSTSTSTTTGAPRKWIGFVEELKPILAESKDQTTSTGKPVLIPVKRKRIVVQNLIDGTRFECSVTKTQYGIKIRDPREEYCGDRATWQGEPGNWQQVAGRKKVSDGKSLMPREWARAFANMLGIEYAENLVVWAVTGKPPEGFKISG